MNKFPLIILSIAFATTAQADPAGDATRGKAFYQTVCSACHSVGYNGIGPAHKHVFGARAGTQSDYTYSPALAASGVTWTEKNLDRWLTQPEALVPGQKMGISVPSAQDRADVIAYLKSLPH
ncbi:MAG: c-type cytochrome [Burkholderiaceae bacterium]